MGATRQTEAVYHKNLLIHGAKINNIVGSSKKMSIARLANAYYLDDKRRFFIFARKKKVRVINRSEEHTSELQSR